MAYCLETDDENAKKVVRLEDISDGGMSFESENVFEKGQGLKIRIFLKNRMFELKAVVVYVRSIAGHMRRIGARFLEIPSEFSIILEKEIQETTELSKKLSSENGGKNMFREASSEYQKRNIL